MATIKRLLPWVMAALCVVLILAIFAVLFSAYVWAEPGSIPPEPEPPTALQLTSMCSNDPAVTRAWRVRNPNSFDVVFLWKLYGTPIDGAATAPASSDYLFETPTQPGANTLIVFVNGVQQAVKASGGQRCNPLLTVVGLCDAGTAEFRIQNTGGDMRTPATWWLVTAPGDAAYCVTDIAYGYVYSGTLQLASGDNQTLAFGAVGGLPPKLCVESQAIGIGYVAAVAAPAEQCMAPTGLEPGGEPEIVPLRRLYLPQMEK